MKLLMNNDMIIFRDKDKIILDLYKEHNQVAINPEFLPVLLLFRSPKDENDIEDDRDNFTTYSESEFDAIVDEFINKHVLIDSEGINEKKLEIDSLNQSTRYYYWANRIFNYEKHETTYHEFMKLGSQRNIQPSVYKEYESKLKSIPLPYPSEIKRDLLSTILYRQSVRYGITKENVSFDAISDLLYYSTGETSYAFDNGMGDALFKPTATPGGRAGNELYLINLSNTNLEKGIYHYSVKKHTLDLIKKGDFNDIMFKISGNQSQVKSTKMMLVLTEKMDRIIWKYHEGIAYRSAMIESGAVMQNIYLIASARKLGVGAIGTFRDDELDKLLNINPNNECVTLMFTMGVMDKNKDRFDQPSIDKYMEEDADERKQQSFPNN